MAIKQAKLNHIPQFESTMAGLTAFNPYHIIPRLPKYGLPIGHTDDGPFYFNPRAWKAHGHVQSTAFAVLGRVGFGKTSLVKNIGVLQKPMRKTRHPGSKLQKYWADSFKASEYSDLADYYQCPPLRMMEARLNPLSSDMELGDQVNTVKRMIAITARQLDPLELSVLRGAVQQVATLDNRNASLPALLHVLNQPRPELAPLLFPDTDERLTISPDSLKDTAQTLSVLLLNMMSDQFVKVFGDETSRAVKELFDQQMASIDFAGAPPDIVRLVQDMFWSIRRRQSENNDPNKFDTIIFDETSGSLRHPEFMVPLHDNVQRIRESNTLIGVVAHGLRNYDSLPDATRRLALSMIQDIPVWFVFQTTVRDAEAIQEHFDCSDTVRDTLTTLRKGECMVFIGTLDPFVMTVDLTPRVREITFSEESLEEMLDEHTASLLT